MTWYPLEPLEGIHFPEGVAPSITGLRRDGPYIGCHGGYLHPNDPIIGRVSTFILSKADIAEAMEAVGFPSKADVEALLDTIADLETVNADLATRLEAAEANKLVSYSEIKKDLHDLHVARVRNEPPKKYVGRPRKETAA